MIAFIDLAKLLADAGFPSGVPSANGIAIVCAESGRDPAATFTNTDSSIDRGLWQINSKWHAEVTDAQAFDPKLATEAAYRISKGGLDFTPWSTWGNGAYRTHLEAARVALDGYARVKSLQLQLSAATDLVEVVKRAEADAEAKAQVLEDRVVLLESKIADAQRDLS